MGHRIEYLGVSALRLDAWTWHGLPGSLAPPPAPQGALAATTLQLAARALLTVVIVLSVTV